MQCRQHLMRAYVEFQVHRTRQIEGHYRGNGAIGGSKTEGSSEEGWL